MDTEFITREAAKLGHDAGIAGASWVFNGNTSDETYRRVLQGITDGDPEIMDAYREPSLSGEFADDYSESDLAADLGLDDDTDEYAETLSEAADAYNQSASEAFWHEVERLAAEHTTSVGSYRCPCCGDDVMDTLPVCSDCRDAGCEHTTDACGEPGYWECQRPRSCTFERIVFMQGDDADEPLDILYSREAGHSFPYYLGATAESVTAAVAYLAQWDNGDAGEEHDTPAAGSADDTWTEGEYILTAHLGLGYIGLERIVTTS